MKWNKAACSSYIQWKNYHVTTFENIYFFEKKTHSIFQKVVCCIVVGKIIF